MKKASFCECGQVKEKSEEMCKECKEWSRNIPRQKRVGLVEKKTAFKIGGKCLKCGGKVSSRASWCDKCYRGKW